MREILFKAKRVKTGEWVEGFYLSDDDLLPGAYICPRLTATCKEKGEMLMGGFVSVDPTTVCEYTGLEDKNGVKIFEGDKCKVSRPCVLAYGKIVFKDGCFWFVDDGPGGMLRLCDVAMNGFEIKVIRSIHDTEGQQ